MLFSCYVYRMWGFFSHSPYVDLFGKESSVDTKQHSCMFHKLQDKKQLSFIFHLFSLVSVECNHTHAESQKYKDLCTVSFHPISLVHTVICFCICWLWIKGLFAFCVHSVFQIYTRTTTEHPKSTVQKTNTICICLYGDVKTLQGGQKLKCLLAKSTTFKLNKMCLCVWSVCRKEEWSKINREKRFPPTSEYCERLLKINYMMCFQWITFSKFRSQCRNLFLEPGNIWSQRIFLSSTNNGRYDEKNEVENRTSKKHQAN